MLVTLAAQGSSTANPVRVLILQNMTNCFQTAVSVLLDHHRDTVSEVRLRGKASASPSWTRKATGITLELKYKPPAVWAQEQVNSHQMQ